VLESSTNLINWTGIQTNTLLSDSCMLFCLQRAGRGLFIVAVRRSEPAYSSRDGREVRICCRLKVNLSASESIGELAGGGARAPGQIRPRGGRGLRLGRFWTWSLSRMFET